MYDPTVARLTYRALLGRRRALILGALPLLLIAISVVVRGLAGADDQTASDLLGGLALATMVPIIGVIAGTGAIGPEIDDGSVVYLLSKPIKRPTIIFTKLIVAIAVTMVFSAVPTLIAGFILNGNGQQIAVAYTVAALVASIAYAALFLLLGTVSRHAVVFGLVYALVWEALFGSLVPGARTLSVQQWSLAVAQKVVRRRPGDLGREPDHVDGAAGGRHGPGHLVRRSEAALADTRRRGVTCPGLDGGLTPVRAHWADGDVGAPHGSWTAGRRRGWRARGLSTRTAGGPVPGPGRGRDTAPGTMPGRTSSWTRTSYAPPEPPSRPPVPGCSPRAGAARSRSPSPGAPTSRPRAGSSARPAAAGGAGASRRLSDADLIGGVQFVRRQSG